ncbi:hypothetical protein GCM10010967_10750 [Dyadobacter beijingensis]|uniref:Peptidase S74 domain-containing protein n=1 Tax=Dyadobacter beijingensis TaxID=365489 RepID=A0ABQ2HGE3_9BACT|nr:tail fiber domain-containing protein [Dyadobacter beijingensis]GGM80797.1 hypothetical protein GCM10010967_10750 [Dyadobacter beijingensis]
MFKNYRKAALAVMGCMISQFVSAQTHYGVGAGTQGQFHSHFGVDAGKVSTGPSNTFIGQEAGANNGVANDNTFVGYKSGGLNVGGIDNTFVGSLAGKSNTTGFQNVFLGREAGGSNQIGGLNVYLGFQAAALNTQGGSNCAIGALANYLGTSGNYNVFVGTQAGEANSGSENVIIGFASGTNNKGDFNVFTGSHAGYSNTSGFENTFLGDYAGYSGAVGYRNTYVGARAGFFNQTGSDNVFLGNWSGYFNTGGQGNTFLGFHAGESNTSGKRNTYVGYNASGDSNLTNATAIGASAKVTASNSLVLGQKASVGIGISAPSFQLHLSTDAAAKPGSALWTVASDRRLKQNITEFNDGLDVLKQIHPVRFQYNGQAGIETGSKQFVGIIAQEMQKIAPYTVGSFTHQDSLGNKTEYLDYDANAVTYILINSVKEQQQVIERKDAELKEMNAQVAALSKRLEQLEQVVASNTAKPLTGNAARVEPNANGVVLEQNAPNGFSKNSSIRFFIPQSVKEASVEVYSVNGIKVNSYPLKERGEGELTISASDFQNGVFLYDLITDGKSNGVKKMVVQK